VINLSYEKDVADKLASIEERLNKLEPKAEEAKTVSEHLRACPECSKVIDEKVELKLKKDGVLETELSEIEKIFDDEDEDND